MENPHINWAINSLYKNGYQLQTPTPEIIQQTPWADVYRFSTNQDYVFLKKTPPALSLEAQVILTLRHDFQANVPYIIANNPDLHCFLMKDAGVRLHDFFQDHFQADIFIQTLTNYAQLQIQTQHKIEQFFHLNVPDWRLEKLPKLYLNLIEQESYLLADGLSITEIKKLRELAAKLHTICEKLSNYPIKETFGHADFHDKNILLNSDNHQTTLIDLGEVVITHPFFSLHNCLFRAKHNFLLSDTQYQDLEFACLKPWLKLDTQEHLFEILTIIKQCWSIHAVLGEFRLMQSVEQKDSYQLQRQGRLANHLRYWINAAS